MPWRRWAQKNHLVSSVFTVLIERQNFLQRQINLLEDDVLPVVAWSDARSCPVCRFRVGLVDDSSREVIRLSQYVNEPANTARSDGERDIQLIGPSTEPLDTRPGQWSPRWSWRCGTRRHGREWQKSYWGATSRCSIEAQRGRGHCKLVAWCVGRYRNCVIGTSSLHLRVEVASVGNLWVYERRGELDLKNWESGNVIRQSCHSYFMRWLLLFVVITRLISSIK